MPLATGLFKQVCFKKEATFGTAPATTLWTPMRRVETTLDLNKETYESNELATTFQTNDFRHGVRRVAGSIKGELAPGAYSELAASVLKRDFTAGTSVALGATTLAIAGSGPTYTLTRSTGSWLTDGIKAGDVVRVTVGAGLTAGNLNKNLLVASLTATVLTVLPLNGLTLATDAATATCTVAVTGKKTYIPTTGHTDYSYAFEQWYADVVQNEVYVGCKFDKLSLSLPPTGMATIGLEVMGQNLNTATARYSTTYNALNTAGLTAAVNGALIVNGAAIATVTGLSIEIDPGFAGDPVVGSNVIPALFAGRVKVSGQFTAYFDTAVLRDYFINETEISLAVALTSTSAANADFVAIVLPRIKVGGAAKSDGEGGIVQTFPFTALYNAAGGTGTSSEQTTVVMQDSLA